MSRPQKHTVDYFAHDADASQGKTLSILFNHFGHEGISAWWQLLERVSKTENHVISIGNPEELEYLAATMRFQPDHLKEILSKMADLEAIDKELLNAGMIWSQNFVNRLESVYKIRKQTLPTKPKFPVSETTLSVSETEFPIPENPQSKVKESKVNKTKGEKGETHHAFGEFSNVKLTPEEYESLVKRLGARGATSWIEEVSLAKASKGYKTKSDYATILAWERREKKLKQENLNSQSNGQGKRSPPARRLGSVPTADELEEQARRKGIL